MKKYTKILLVITEIGVVIWAIRGMFSSHSYSSKCGGFLQNCEYYFPLVFVYFLSATLILYLLRKYEK